VEELFARPIGCRAPVEGITEEGEGGDETDGVEGACPTQKLTEGATYRMVGEQEGQHLDGDRPREEPPVSEDDGEQRGQREWQPRKC
jgi:hypothetical protein